MYLFLESSQMGEEKLLERRGISGGLDMDWIVIASPICTQKAREEFKNMDLK